MRIGSSGQQEKSKEGLIIGALQPGYLPWIGFFDQVFHADLFILFDDLDYTKKDWRNRNRIKGPNGVQWLTVPVQHPSGRKIHQVKIDEAQNWQHVHWKTIVHCYGKAPYFTRYRDTYREIYQKEWTNLRDLDVHLIRILLREFGIRTKIVLSSAVGLEKKFCKGKPRDHFATRRIVHLMNHFGAQRFLQGQAGKNYVQEEILKEAGITIGYQSFEPKPYPQLFGPFIPCLSAIDLLFNCGPDSLEFIVHSNPFDD